MRLKSIILFIVAVVGIYLFFNIERYHMWLTGNIFNPNAQVLDQAKNMDIEYRKEYRYGETYAMSKFLKEWLQKNNITDGLILVPPQGYFQEKGRGDFASVEPALFYYYAGIKTVWVSSKNVNEANYVLLIQGHDITINKLTPEILPGLLASFKKYPPSL